MSSVSDATLGIVVAIGDTPDSGACPFRGIAREVIAVRAAEEALKAVQATGAELIVVRETVPRDAALLLVRQVQSAAPDKPVVVLSDAPTVDEAILFIRHGASDYLPTPMDEKALQPALALAPATRHSDALNRYLAPECPAGVGIVGQSEAIRRALKTIHQV
ncbi:MAG: hypothetical protein U9R68_10065, partial [Planctomycetota bacterium]|nr:hypothetical protein [Planctomycetota bacterium]